VPLSWGIHAKGLKDYQLVEDVLTIMAAVELTSAAFY
jgi:hypothetical protein